MNGEVTRFFLGLWKRDFFMKIQNPWLEQNKKFNKVIKMKTNNETIF